MIRHAPSIGLGLGLSLRGSGVGFTGLLDLYGGASAAYSLRALSRGWLAGDVVEVRPSHGAATQSFTASQITSGAMLDFVNGGTSDLYNSARYFNGTSTEVTIPDSPDFTISTSIDVSADVLLTSNATVGIVNKGIGVVGNREWSLNINLSNQLEFVVFDGSLSTNIKAFTTDFPTNKLFTARGYYDGSDIYIYVNGVQKATTAGVIAIENLAADIQIGNTLAASRHLHGIVSNVSILVDGTGVAAYTGLGTSVTAWEDTIGSNDGTETNGAAYTGQPFDGFVSTWYDQSGNANDATQATTTSQPKIVDAGSLVTDANGKPWIDFQNAAGGGIGLDIASNIRETNGASSIFASIKFDQIFTGSNEYQNPLFLYDTQRWLVGSTTGPVSYKDICISDASGLVGDYRYVRFPSTLTNHNLLTSIYDGSSTTGGGKPDIQFNENSAAKVGTDGSLDFGVPTTGNNSIGYRMDTSSQGCDAKFQEVIIYDSDQSANRVAIETNINEFYSIY